MTRLKEIFKSILIVLLLLSSLFLLLLALPVNVVSRLPLPQNLTELLGVDRQVQTSAPADPSKLTTAATPLVISVQNSSGRHTVKRNAVQLETAYGALAAFLSRALTTAQDGTESVPADTNMLHKTGIVFSFGGEIPAEALCRWLADDTTAVTESAQDYLLFIDGRHVVLYLGGTQPMLYRTAVSAAALADALETYTPDGSSFAAERDGHLHPLSLWEPTVLLPAYTAENPIAEGFATSLATALDFNPYGAGTYTDPEGNTIFSETDRSLTVSADGTVTVAVQSSTLPRFTAAEDSPAAKIEVARALLDTIVGSLAGDARLQLTNYTADGCSFTYILDGTPVAPAACTATFSGTLLTELTATLRTYHLTTAQHRLMPIDSATAIAESGARLIPAYTLTGTPGWHAQ